MPVFVRKIFKLFVVIAEKELQEKKALVLYVLVVPVLNGLHVADASGGFIVLA